MNGKVTWITGSSTAGKTTLAWQMKRPGDVVIDGDEIRFIHSNKGGYSFGDTWRHNVYVAHLAALVARQGVHVFVALVCPYKKLRDEVQAITDCSFVYLSGGNEDEYEYEQDKKYFRADK